MNLKFSLYQHKYKIGGTDSSDKSKPRIMSHNLIWFAPEGDGVPVPEIGAGNGQYVTGDKLSDAFGTCSNALRFEINKADADAVHGPNETLLAVEEFSWPEQKAALRLDQVTFPQNAIAYRHVHWGAGFRHLVAGGLEIDAGDHQQDMNPGDSWFEDINSPVKATAKDGCVSQFIRAMVLPLEFLGKPTIRILDPEDAKKTTSQKNHRFVDQVVDLW